MNRSNGFLSKQAGKSLWTSTPREVFACAAMLLPALGIVAARHMLPARGPQVAMGQEAVSPTNAESSVSPAGPTRRGTLSASDLATLRIFDESAAKQINRSPLAVDVASPRDDTAPTTLSGTRAARANFTGHLTAILNAQGRSVAMLGGKLRHAGEAIGSGWTLTSIDPQDGSAIITHTSGVTQVLRLRDRDKGNLVR